MYGCTNNSTLDSNDNYNSASMVGIVNYQNNYYAYYSTGSASTLYICSINSNNGTYTSCTSTIPTGWGNSIMPQGIDFASY